MLIRYEWSGLNFNRIEWYGSAHSVHGASWIWFPITRLWCALAVCDLIGIYTKRHCVRLHWIVIGNLIASSLTVPGSVVVKTIRNFCTINNSSVVTPPVTVVDKTANSLRVFLWLCSSALVEFPVFVPENHIKSHICCRKEKAKTNTLGLREKRLFLLFNILRCHVSCRACMIYFPTSDEREKPRRIKFSRHKMWFALKMCANCNENWFCCGCAGVVGASVVTIKLNSQWGTSDLIEYISVGAAGIVRRRSIPASRYDGKLRRLKPFQLFHLSHYNPHDILPHSFLSDTCLMHKRWSDIIKFSIISFLVSSPQSTTELRRCDPKADDQLDDEIVETC